MGDIDTGKVAELVERARREVDDGLLPSCQVALAKDGEIVMAETFGDATPDTRYVVFSATKPFVAGVIWQLMGEGSIDITLPVGEVIPEFATNGKEGITIEQVLLHTSGFPQAPLGPPAWSTREGRLERFGQWKLNWEPGTRFEYHPTSAHWVLAELITRVTGQDHRDAVHERITQPLGLGDGHRILGVPDDDQQGIAELELRGDPAGPDELEATFGVRELPVGEVTDAALLGFNEPDAKRVGVPGGGGVMRAVDLASYYQALLHNPAELWPADVLADVTSHVRNSKPDPLLGIPANRSLGLVLAGDDGKSSLRGGFGHTVSPGAFGHAGAAGQIAWADPATGLSFAYVTNGIDANIIRQSKRGTALSSRAAVCASTATGD